MNEHLVTKFKFYRVWQDDKKEQWLQGMALQGLHLADMNRFGCYRFRQGQPANVTYRLDFARARDADGAYFQLFEDAGWQHVTALMGCQIWRKAARAGQTQEIFTDVESKVQKFQRLSTFLTSAFVLLPVGAALAGWLMMRAAPPATFDSFGGGFMVGGVGGGLLMLGMARFQIARRIGQLRGAAN